MYNIVYGIRDESGDISYLIKKVHGIKCDFDDRLFIREIKNKCQLIDIASGRLICTRNTIKEIIISWEETFKVKYNRFIQTDYYRNHVKLFNQMVEMSK